MAIYLFFYSLVTLLFFGVDRFKHEKNVKKFLLFLSFSILAAFAGLRGNVGTDIGRYTRDYEYVKNLEFFSVFESYDFLPYDFLYSTIYVIFGNILRLDFWSIKFAVSLIFIFCFYKFSERFKNYGLSAIILVPVLYLFFSFSLIRQSISICIGLYVLVLFLDRQFIKFFLLSLIGVLFHKYFLIFPISMIMVLAIQKFEFKNIINYLLILFVIIFLFFIFYRYTMLGHYNWYVLTSPSNHALQYPLLKLFFTNLSYILIFFLISIGKSQKFDDIDILIFVISIFSILFLSIHTFAPIVTFRFMMYFVVINPLIVIKFMKTFNNKFNSLILIILFIIHSLYITILLNFSSHAGSYVPYKLYFL